MYENRIKESWRYWAWKQLKQRSATQSKLATVMFLCGPGTADVDAAVKNGFRKENIVGVDNSQANIKNLRACGCVGVCGDLSRVVSQYDGQIHGVLADYCGGMTAERWQESSFIVAQVNGGAVMNFQRGRECSAGSKRFHAALREHGFDGTHRGVQWVVANSIELWNVKEYGPDIPDVIVEDYFSVIFEDAKLGAATADLHDAIELYKKVSQPAFYSYRANSVYMDSVAVTHRTPLGHVDQKKRFNTLLDKLAKRANRKGRSQMKGKLTALKAVRTTRGAT